METSFVVETIVIALLAATIFYMFKLEGKLDAMRKAQTSLGKVVLDLNTAAARAEAGIQGLKATADSSGKSLEATLKRAQAMVDELNILVASGERLGERMELSRQQPPALRRMQAGVR